jgi:hypothetical protein
MMKINRTGSLLTHAMIFLPVIFSLAGCAAKKPLAESPETGLTLSYKLPQETGLYYISKSDINQTMEIQGQSISADIEQVMAFDMEPLSASDDKLTLDITLDTLGIAVKSAMMNISADVKEVLGKRFSMILSDKGEELDLSGAEPIKYSMAQAGSRSIALNFQEFFPDLPAQKIKIGDTWSETDTINEISETEEVVMILESTNTFEGIENVGGYECVKIVSQIHGPRNGTQNAQGITLTTKGDVEGVMTWYFAYKEGFFVKSIMESTAESSISTSGAQTFTFPMTQKINSVVEISEK